MANKSDKQPKKTKQNPVMVETHAGTTYGAVLSTVGDLEPTSMAFALPLPDYQNSCYMWQVPNGEVVVPGNDLYRLPVTHGMLSVFGFLDSDRFEDNNMIVVSSCSNWGDYASQRRQGNWKALLRQLQNNESASTNSTGIPPANATVASWDSLASLEFKWVLCADNVGIIPMPNEQAGTDFVNDIKVNGKTYLSTLAPAIPENYLASTDFSSPENVLVEVVLGTCTITSGFEDIPILCKLPFSVVQEEAGGKYVGTTDFDFNKGVFTGSVSINGVDVSPSNFHLQLQLTAAKLK